MFTSMLHWGYEVPFLFCLIRFPLSSIPLLHFPEALPIFKKSLPSSLSVHSLLCSFFVFCLTQMRGTMLYPTPMAGYSLGGWISEPDQFSQECRAQWDPQALLSLPHIQASAFPAASYQTREDRDRVSPTQALLLFGSVQGKQKILFLGIRNSENVFRYTHWSFHCHYYTGQVNSKLRGEVSAPLTFMSWDLGPRCSALYAWHLRIITLVVQGNRWIFSILLWHTDSMSEWEAASAGEVPLSGYGIFHA